MYDFPKNCTIKNGESIRILAMGLHLDKIQNVTFIFDNHADNEIKINF